MLKGHRLLESESHLSKGDDVAGIHLGRIDTRAVQKRPVARSKIADDHAVIGALHLGVPARDRRIDHRNVAGRGAPHDQQRAGPQLERL